MVRQLKSEAILEDRYAAMSASFWARNKAPSVNLNETPFAADRQLEDQNFMRMQNRNPQITAILKSDKMKSTKKAKTKVGDPLKNKASVLNKIVREASGVFNYALVAPIHRKEVSEKSISAGAKIDPDTCPLVEPYRKESSSKPMIVSFGHRPSSASLTFCPGTMQVRLRHGQVVQKPSPGKSSFGLSSSVLHQLLHAPRLPRPGEELDEIEKESLGDQGSFGTNMYMQEQMDVKSSSSGQNFRKPGSNVHFSLDDTEAVGIHYSEDHLTGINSVRSTDVSSIDIANSSTAIGSKSRKKKKNGTLKSLEHVAPWNESFHLVYRPPNEKILLRSNGAKHALPPLHERLRRFNKISANLDPSSGFCDNKRMTDKMLAVPLTFTKAIEMGADWLDEDCT